MTKCPLCGQPWPHDKPKRSYESRTITFANSSRSLDSVAAIAQPVPDGFNISRERPLFLPTVEAHVTVPRAQALTSAAFAAPAVGLAVGGITYLGGSPFWTAAGFGAIAGGVAFFGYAWRKWEYGVSFYNGLLSSFEEMTGQDINHDGQIGRPEPEVTTVEVINGNSRVREEFPVGGPKMREFAKMVVSANPVETFSERTASKAGISRDDLERIRNIFIAHHWGRWKDQTNRRLGFELRQSGEAILQALAAGRVIPGIRAGGDDPDSLMSSHLVDRSTGRGNW